MLIFTQLTLSPGFLTVDIRSPGGGRTQGVTMKTGSPVTCLVGNSACISKIDEPLREQVTELYNAFWKVWDGCTSPLEFTALGTLFFPFFLKVILECFDGVLRASLLAMLVGGYVYCARDIYREYDILREEGRQEFAQILCDLPNARRVLGALLEIEPWRMALLRDTLLPAIKVYRPSLF